MYPHRRRTALTLVELLVVLAISGILLALLIPAVQKVRSAALHAHSANNVRQIGLALHNYENTNRHSPRITIAPLRNGDFEYSFLFALLPYLEQGNYQRMYQEKYPKGGVSSALVIPVFVSPLDPSEPNGGANYAANAEVYRVRRTLHRIRDGTSNTVGVGKHYSYVCGGIRFSWVSGTRNSFHQPDILDSRRLTFADKKMGDVYPVTRGGVTTASVAGVTFQPAPALSQCNPAVAQALSP